ncbi:FAD binding domain-containing protein [Xylariomycetidae sp. FL2044]|nr:FAD binding domain-containing protein [Xylariomycetidae sp. FL2044]
MIFVAMLTLGLQLALAALGKAQTIVVNNQVLNADESTVAPAVEVIETTSSNATADLFPGEARQLTDKVLANLTDLGLTNIVLFGFGDLASVANESIIGPCKTFPGEFVVFPGQITSRVFDLLLGGRLLDTTPLSSPCYSNYGNADASKCDDITSKWSSDSMIHTNDPTCINAILYQGTTCVPHTINPYLTNCTLGSYPTLSVNVSTVAQIQLGINMARNLNLRLVVKNTGSDYNAKSTGAGALSLWTHNMKDIKFYEDYEEGSYKGPAFKMGAGVQSFEGYEAAQQANVTILGGEARTIGLAGGYILGGGHSPLSSVYGMASDQVLSMEIVTADGRFVTASEASNPDLFWALRGGGGSTYGVMTSMVIKAHPKIAVTTMTFALTTNNTMPIDLFWECVGAFFKDFIKYTDAGNYMYFKLDARSGNWVFNMQPWFAPNMNEAELRNMTSPFFEKLDALGMHLDPVYHEFDNFFDAWDTSFPDEPWGSNLLRQGSRLFPRENWEDPARLAATFQVIRYVVDSGGLFMGFTLTPNPASGYPDTAVNPAWRHTVLHAIDAVTWDQDMYTEIIAIWSQVLTLDWGPAWRKVSPNSGAYLSEADYIEPNFQQSFWGDNYDRLYRLKQQLDPWGLFYSQNAVGSEDWEMSGYVFGNLPSQNSHLCRKGEVPPVDKNQYTSPLVQLGAL